MVERQPLELDRLGPLPEDSNPTELFAQIEKLQSIGITEDEHTNQGALKLEQRAQNLAKSLSRRFSRHTRNASAPPMLAGLAGLRQSATAPSPSLADGLPQLSARADDDGLPPTGSTSQDTQPPPERDCISVSAEVEASIGRTGHGVPPQSTVPRMPSWRYVGVKSVAKSTTTVLPEVTVYQAQLVLEGSEDVADCDLVRC